LSEIDQLENANKCYDELIKLNPNKHDYFFNKALLLIKLESYEEAITASNKVLELNPEYHGAYGKLGRNYFYYLLSIIFQNLFKGHVFYNLKKEMNLLLPCKKLLSLSRIKQFIMI